jgi:hypothetical protein
MTTPAAGGRDQTRTVACEFDAHQLDLIDYIQEENRLLKERLGGQRIRFTDAERRRLARKAFALGRKALNELQTLVTPDTLCAGTGNWWQGNGTTANGVGPAGRAR